MLIPFIIGLPVRGRPQYNTVAPEIRTQRRMFRQCCKIYGASKERIVARVSSLSSYLTSMDVSNKEDKEKWMSGRLQQSMLTQTELHTLITISCVIMCRPSRWKLAWFYCNSAINLSFAVRPTEGNSFCAEASGPALRLLPLFCQTGRLYLHRY